MTGDGSETPLIRAEGLKKTYPPRDRRTAGFQAVAGIDFHVDRGEAFGFLGPNGAGKSSTMRMLGCVSTATAGTLRILGMDPARDGRSIRARLGVVPQDDVLDPDLTVHENLTMYGLYFGLPRRVIRERAQRLLEFAQLEEKAGEKLGALSGGMRRRLTIARSLINEPDILLLDEPTTGLDPQARHVLWDRLFRLKQQGVTLLLTTHYMDEAEQLCDRLVVMDKGLIADEGSPQELIRRHSTREVLELRFRIDEHEQAAEKLHDRIRTDEGERVEVLPDRVLVYTHDGEATLAEVTAARMTPITALVRRSTLEDVFLRLSGRTLTD